ncbi:g5642 [Coccomyxa elongata]
MVASANAANNTLEGQDTSKGGEAPGADMRPLPEQLAAQQEAAVEEEETGPDLGTKRQYLVVMRHGERLDEIDVSWRAQSLRPWDPPLSPKGEKQASDVAAKLKQYDFGRVYISPFLRTLQTALHTCEGLGIPPEKWTVTCSVSEFLNPGILVKKPAKLPDGHINTWFWEKGNMEDTLKSKVPNEYGKRVNLGEKEFGRYPENLLNSRVRYSRAFKKITDEADGENVLVVAHWDAVSGSVARLRPWAISDKVVHTGFTVAYREEMPDGTWGKWHLETKNGEGGVHWVEAFKPLYIAGSTGQKVYRAASGLVGKLNPFHHRKDHSSSSSNGDVRT